MATSIKPITLTPSKSKSNGRGLNSRPQHYKCRALPLSYSCLVHHNIVREFDVLNLLLLSLSSPLHASPSHLPNANTLLLLSLNSPSPPPCPPLNIQATRRDPSVRTLPRTAAGSLLAPQNAVLHLKRTHTSLVLGLCGCSPPVGQVGTFTGSGTPRPARRCAAFEARGVN